MSGGTFDGVVLEPRPWLSGGVCTPHSLDLELEDMAKLPWIKDHLAEMRRVVKFIRGHQYSLFLWRQKTDYALLLPGDTRFATEFIMAGRLQKEKAAAAEMVADRRYSQWLDGTLEGKKKAAKSYKAEGLWAKGRVLDEEWWLKGELILEIVNPIVELLRLGDSEVPLMGKVYYRMFLIKQKLEDPTFAPRLKDAHRRQLVKIHTDRWEYMHNVYHATGYALDPEFVKHSQHTITEVMDGLRLVIKRHYHNDPAKRALALQQFMVFKNRKKGVFSEEGTFDMAKDMPAHEWWELFGAELPEIQAVAMKVLSKRSSACSVERLWSLFGLVWSNARASLGPAKAIDLVKAGANLRLKEKLLTMDYEAQMRSWTVDPEESDDEE